MQNSPGSACEQLSPTVKGLLRDAASKLTAQRRRAFMAKVAVELLGGSAWQAENQFGWNRRTVELGLHERASGIVCVDNFAARGNKKSESKRPELERDIRALADPHSQADPQFRSTLSYTRLSAAAVRRALIQEKGWREEDLPAERTMNSNPSTISSDILLPTNFFFHASALERSPKPFRDDNFLCNAQ